MYQPSTEQTWNTRWPGCLVGLDHRHPFETVRGPIPLSGSPTALTLTMAGYWGSGAWNDPGKTYPAKTVLEQMVETRPDFMVHLGDVYYAGTPAGLGLDPNEEKRYFIDLWQPGSRGALALNSNHEMYSGANGLFEALDSPLFEAQKGATYFAIEIENWLVLGPHPQRHRLLRELPGGLHPGSLLWPRRPALRQGVRPRRPRRQTAPVGLLLRPHPAA